MPATWGACATRKRGGHASRHWRQVARCWVFSAASLSLFLRLLSCCFLLRTGKWRIGLCPAVSSPRSCAYLPRPRTFGVPFPLTRVLQSGPEGTSTPVSSPSSTSGPDTASCSCPRSPNQVDAVVFLGGRAFPFLAFSHVGRRCEEHGLGVVEFGSGDSWWTMMMMAMTTGRNAECAAARGAGVQDLGQWWSVCRPAGLCRHRKVVS